MNREAVRPSSLAFQVQLHRSPDGCIGRYLQTASTITKIPSTKVFIDRKTYLWGCTSFPLTQDSWSGWFAQSRNPFAPVSTNQPSNPPLPPVRHQLSSLSVPITRIYHRKKRVAFIISTESYTGGDAIELSRDGPRLIPRLYSRRRAPCLRDFHASRRAARKPSFPTHLDRHRWCLSRRGRRHCVWRAPTRPGTTTTAHTDTQLRQEEEETTDTVVVMTITSTLPADGSGAKDLVKSMKRKVGRD